MKIADDTVTLDRAETKLLLAALMRAKYGPSGWMHDPVEFDTTFTTNTIAGLATALFGSNAAHVSEYDIVQLHHEAYAEWRKG
jgi:hypothetical protein